MTTCTLCDLPADPPVTAESVDGTFCCRGCLNVYETLGDVDVEEPSDGTGGDDIPESAETAYLAVDGMHCGTCELYLESVAGRAEGVYSADASYAAETVRVAYDPETQTTEGLVEAVSGLGYSARRRDAGTDAGTDAESRLLVGAIFGMMAMTWYALFLYPTYFGFDPVVEFGTFDGAYLYGQLAVLTAIILFYTGQPVLRGAYVSVRTRQPNVDLLVTIAALAAYLYSTGRLLVGGTDLYYDVTIVVVLAVTVGNYYEERIKQRATGLLTDLTELQVEQATRADGETVPVEAVDPGDRLVVRPGKRVPVDGTIREGTAAVDEALVTGESVPETRGPGDEVRGGTVVTDAPLVVEVGENADSTLDHIVGMLWDIQATRPGAQRVADKLATVFVPLVLTLAVTVVVVLLATGTAFRPALLTGLTVLIVSCPCALGLATPLAVAAGLRSAADRGVVVATPALFESVDDVGTVVFDKTGTVTGGDLTVTAVTAVGTREQQLLARAAQVEQFSTHPVARAVVEESPDDATVDEVDGFERYDDGVGGTVDGKDVLVAHPDRFHEREWVLPTAVDEQVHETRQAGNIPTVVGWDGRAYGVVAVGEQVRPEWDEVARLLGADSRVVVLTGDEEESVGWLRDHPSVDAVFAGVPPDGKAETVRRLAASETVAMVGDGSNDAPALAAADIGVAVGDRTKLATDAADAVVVDGDLRSVPAVFGVARRTKRRIRENLAWAFLYNGIAVPLALAGLINPLFAAAAMATSSLVVVANSARSQARDGRETPEGNERQGKPAGTPAPS
ncbi:MAG: heavy metal translocating P-type ATPase [Halovenus sp.]